MNPIVNVKVAVSPVPESASHADLTAIFSEYGTVQAIDRPLNPQTGNPGPLAMITYKTEAEANKASEKKKTVIADQTVTISKLVPSNLV